MSIRNKFFIFVFCSIFLFPACSSKKAITYDGNGNTAGTVPVDNNSYSAGSDVTPLGNEGGLVKTGSLLVGWNTLSNGSGASYLPGKTFTMGPNVMTLYAQWADKWSKEFSDAANTRDATTSSTVLDSNNNLYYSNGYFNLSIPSVTTRIIKRTPSGVETTIYEADNVGIFSLAVDSSDNLYASGATGVEIYGKTPVGMFAPFVSKYDSNGVHQWTALIDQTNCAPTCTALCLTTKVSVDSITGSVYLAGSTNAPELEGVAQIGPQDAFIAKYNPDTESWEWLLRDGEALTWVGSPLQVVAGSADASVYFSTVLVDAGDPTAPYKGYVRKYSEEGSVIWAKDIATISPAGQGAGVGLALDNTENFIYVSGQLNQLVAASSGFVHKLSTIDGAYATGWPVPITADTEFQNISATKIAIDAFGDIYIAGSTNSYLDSDDYIYSQPVTSAFTSKLSQENGETLWTRYYGRVDENTDIYSLSLDSFNNTYVSGQLNTASLAYDKRGFITTELNQ